MFFILEDKKAGYVQLRSFNSHFPSRWRNGLKSASAGEGVQDGGAQRGVTCPQGFRLPGFTIMSRVCGTRNVKCKYVFTVALLASTPSNVERDFM